MIGPPEGAARRDSSPPAPPSCRGVASGAFGRASFPPGANLDQKPGDASDPSGLGVILGDVAIRRATTTLRRGRYADGFEVGIVTLDANVTARERWLFERGLEIMLAHAWDPGIIPVRDVAATREAYAVVCARCTLADLSVLELPLEDRLRIARQVGLTLSTLHASGHVHGCLAAHNVILVNDLRPVLDEVAMVDLHESLGGDLDGSRGYGAYAAPEATRAGPLTTAADVYALGRLLELLIVGEPPVPGSNASYVARKLAGRAPGHLVEAVRRALATDPERRFPTVGAVLEEGRLDPPVA